MSSVFFNTSVLRQQPSKGPYLFEPYRVEPVLYPEDVVFGKLVYGSHIVIGIFKGLPVIVGLYELLVLLNDPLSLLCNSPVSDLSMVSPLSSLST